MKNVRKKVLSAIMTLSVIISCAPSYSVYAVKSDKDLNIVADYISESKDCLYADGASVIQSKEDAVKWRQDGSDGKYYSYLPTGSDLSKLKIWHTFDGNVTC